MLNPSSIKQRLRSSTTNQRVWPQAINQVLSNRQEQSLHYIMRHINRLVIINNFLNQHLPANVRLHCQAMQCTPTELTIAVQSAVWLTRLRYLQTELLSELRQHPQFLHLSKISLRIQPVRLLPAPPPKYPRLLSNQAHTLLQTLAKSIKNPELQRALLNLSRTSTRVC